MTRTEAWLILASQIERDSVHPERPLSNEEHLAALTALSLIAGDLGLDQQRKVTQSLMHSLRETDAKQLQFREMLQAEQGRKEGGDSNGNGA